MMGNYKFHSHPLRYKKDILNYSFWTIRIHIWGHRITNLSIKGIMLGNLSRPWSLCICHLESASNNSTHMGSNDIRLTKISMIFFYNNTLFRYINLFPYRPSSKTSILWEWEKNLWICHVSPKIARPILDSLLMVMLLF